jgi:putative transposase
MKSYPTNLTDSQWQCIEKILNDKRKRKVSLRVVVDGILYLVRTGCQWRMLPECFGRWVTVYYYFRKWVLTGIWRRVQAKLRQMVRVKFHRKACPSLGIIDSQSVKNSEWGIPDKGFDGNKKINGRKRHIVVDTMGLLMSVSVTKANVHDSIAAEGIIRGMKGVFPRLKKILGDGGYAGDRLVKLAQEHLKADFEVVTRGDETNFKVIPKRWVVERSIAWFSWFRRLSKDYEANMQSSEAYVLIASIAMLIKKI